MGNRLKRDDGMRSKPCADPQRAWVVVLGDAGRSPRMQYHALSLCKTGGFLVNLVGYAGSPLIPELESYREEGRLVMSDIASTPRWILRVPRLLQLPLKALFQLFILIWMLCIGLPRPDVILLQIPPAIPTMLVCSIAAKIRGARLVYDWHNFAHTIMAISGLGEHHPLVRVARGYEKAFARSSHGAMCVTRAMKDQLQREWGAEAEVFYDTAPDIYRPATQKETHQLFIKLSPVLRQPVHARDSVSRLQEELEKSNASNTNETKTLITIESNGDASIYRRLDAERPVVLVSSTSWTPDEDFGILLGALVQYDALARNRTHLPLLLVFVTGKGPQKQQYEERMRSLDLRKVSIRTVWLEPEDYPILLGSADLGISLHASSSGVDLPMKVVDMFGSGLPVCALEYPCIAEEMVKHGENGLLFRDARDLADQLSTLLEGYMEATSPQSASSIDDGEATRKKANSKRQTKRTSGSGFKALHNEKKNKNLLIRLQTNMRERPGRKYWHEVWLKHALPVICGRETTLHRE
eukprot:jgi/Picsp_1/5224/NSC_02587-R1_beta- -mannosyltransferase